MEAVELQSRLLHTWPVFFARHGNFTAVQRTAIPPILAGRHTLIVAATAAGKTEAALAPLLEHHLFDERRPPPNKSLLILYLCPTRALVRNLYERLRLPLEELQISLSMKSGDTGPVVVGDPPMVLITTPESTDALLTRAPRLFTTLRAVVLDEIHLLDDSVRGDHVRSLLQRITIIQRYHRQQTGGAHSPPFQRVALSATVADPTGIAARYLTVDEPDGSPPQIVSTPGHRRLLADLTPLTTLDDLVNALALRHAAHTPLRKALIFCNTRNEVEQVAGYLRQQLPYAARIFVHYSNLDSTVRQEVEDGFAEAGVALCVCTSTLELGIDIGSVDDVVLIGPPPSLASFLQRIGRGGRRRGVARVLALFRSNLEALHLRALIGLAQQGARSPVAAPSSHFRLSVLVQQLFSSLKQSPIAALRLADLRRLAPPEVTDDELRQLLGHLTTSRYLQPGRPGEWKAGIKLNELIDAHEIYSNIGADPLKIEVVDAYSGRTLALTEHLHLEGDTLLIGGQILQVLWRDRHRIGVQARPGFRVEEELRYTVTPFAANLEIGQAVAQLLGVPAHRLCLINTEQGSWLFHFWGDLYGELLAALLQPHMAEPDLPEDELPPVRRKTHALRLPLALSRLPPWNEALAHRLLLRLLPRLEARLDLGRFHGLLHPALAEYSALQQCHLPRFAQLYQQATIIPAEAALRIRLLELVE
jgi:ATP-dependent Lhr-like helicase